MAGAFAKAVEAGRTAYTAGMGKICVNANASSPESGRITADLGFLA
jgi:thiazole synthase ThiGH ThiG subunit